jgi:hypothetical protein
MITLDENINTTKKHRNLFVANKEVGLEINAENTK